MFVAQSRRMSYGFLCRDEEEGDVTDLTKNTRSKIPTAYRVTIGATPLRSANLIKKRHDRPSKILRRLIKLPSPKFLQKWPDYTGLITSDADVTDLLEILALHDESGIFDKDIHDALIHAIRILTQLQDRRATGPLAELLIREAGHDGHVLTDVIQSLEFFGELAVPVLCQRLISDEIWGMDVERYVLVVEVLTRIALAHPGERPAIASCLGQMLDDARFLPFGLNAAVVCALTKMDTRSDLASHERPFDKKIIQLIENHFVDQDALDWVLIEQRLGLKPDDCRKPPRLKTTGNPCDVGDRRFEMLLRSINSGWTAAEVTFLMLGSVLSPRPKSFQQIVEVLLTDPRGEVCRIEHETKYVFFEEQLMSLRTEIIRDQRYWSLLPRPDHLAGDVACFGFSDPHLVKKTACLVVKEISAFMAGFLLDDDLSCYEASPIIRGFLCGLGRMRQKISDLQPLGGDLKLVENACREAVGIWSDGYQEFKRACDRERQGVRVSRRLVTRGLTL
jgi:hypothetical protein